MQPNEPTTSSYSPEEKEKIESGFNRHARRAKEKLTRAKNFLTNTFTKKGRQKMVAQKEHSDLRENINDPSYKPDHPWVRRGRTGAIVRRFQKGSKRERQLAKFLSQRRQHGKGLGSLLFKMNGPRGGRWYKKAVAAGLNKEHLDKVTNNRFAKEVPNAQA